MPSTKLPIDTPFEELPSIFKNWNKQTTNLQLSEKELNQLLLDKEITIPIKFAFPNRFNNFLVNKMKLDINLSIKSEKPNERVIEISLTNKNLKDLRKKKELQIQLFSHKVILKHVKK